MKPVKIADHDQSASLLPALSELPASHTKAHYMPNPPPELALARGMHLQSYRLLSGDPRDGIDPKVASDHVKAVAKMSGVHANYLIAATAYLLARFFETVTLLDHKGGVVTRDLEHPGVLKSEPAETGRIGR